MGSSLTLEHEDEDASRWLNNPQPPALLVGVINTGAHKYYLLDKKVAALAEDQSDWFFLSGFYHQ